jgi:hypothetical protein
MHYPHEQYGTQWIGRNSDDGWPGEKEPIVWQQSRREQGGLLGLVDGSSVSLRSVSAYSLWFENHKYLARSLVCRHRRSHYR